MNNTAVVLDASAVLCLLLSEPGADKVEALLERSVLGAVNYSDVVSKLVDRGLPPDDVVSDMSDLGIPVLDIDRELGEIAARMRTSTRRIGLSLGDRMCLALAKKLDVEAVTTDKAWAQIASEIGVSVVVVR